ncbi:penicillin-insensitive murein endopeptidase, partial [Roseomonas arctica]|nr:penicillin-insensitive murein endopeptidase [Plastoroseomonas arctica]
MRVARGLMLGLMLVAAPAIAQKPGAAPPAIAPGLPTTKPPPLG